LKPEVVDYATKMPPSSHAIFLYDSEDEKRTLLFAYVHDRVQKGELVSYYVHQGSPDKVEDAMARFGIDVDTWKRRALLEVLKFDPKIVELAAKTPAREILKGIYEAKGKRAMSLISDNSLSAWTPEKLLENERSHGKRMAVPVAFLCAYPSADLCKIWNGEYFIDMLKAHGHAIFPGIAFALE
jgi:hypothetical protein